MRWPGSSGPPPASIGTRISSTPARRGRLPTPRGGSRSARPTPRFRSRPGADQSRAAEDAAALKDLTLTIMHLGLPCGRVVSAKRPKDDDHIAACKDGKRHRVFIDSDGQDVAQRLP